MEIKEITSNKKKFMDILLIGDEDESMIDIYLDKSSLYVLYESDKTVSICAVLRIDEKIIEVKNLATFTEFQNQGYASALLNFIFEKYKKHNYAKIILGTGENAKTLNFYKKRGFVETHRIKNYFIDNYSHPIIENGKQLVDMIYLQKNL